MTEPLYKQVINALIQRIANGEYLPGSMLPSESDLAGDLNVSQGTARKALMELEQKGILQRSQGKGTFVTVRTPENSLFHFFRLRTSDGQQVAPELLSSSVKVRASTKEEKSLLFNAPKKVYEISRIRTFNDKPLCHELSIIPVELFPGLDERNPLPNALYVMFQQAYSCVVISAEEHLTANQLTDPIASLLHQDAGTPVIVAQRRARDLLERVVELRTTTILTNGTSYNIDLR